MQIKFKFGIRILTLKDFPLSTFWILLGKSESWDRATAAGMRSQFCHRLKISWSHSQRCVWLYSTGSGGRSIAIATWTMELRNGDIKFSTFIAEAFSHLLHFEHSTSSRTKYIFPKDIWFESLDVRNVFEISEDFSPLNVMKLVAPSTS